MEFIINSDLWKTFNDFTKYSHSLTSYSDHLTQLQKNDLAEKRKREFENLEKELVKYIGKYMQCKGSISEISEHQVGVIVYGVLLKYLTGWSSQKEHKEASLAFEYDNKFRAKLLKLQKNDNVKLIGRINSITVNGHIALQLISIEKTGCFIATAVFGDYYSEEVQILNNFKNEILVKSIIGNLFVSIYYFISPSIANIISKSNFLKYVVRKLLLYPIVTMLKRKQINDTNE